MIVLTNYSAANFVFDGFRVFNTMARSKINVDIILQSYGKKGTNDISFTVPLQDADAAAEALSELQESIGFDHLSVDTNVCKVSIVGAGMMSASGIAALMFEALYDAKINIQMISTSEIKVSVLIEKGYGITISSMLRAAEAAQTMAIAA